jgi:hypothetical protein
LNKNEAVNQAKLEKGGENVTEAVNQIVAALRKFPRQMNLSLTGKGENLDVSAEEELIKCCKTIEESIKKLDHLRPDGKKPGSMDEANTGLIDAATTAAKATGFLSQCALHAQKERAAIGKSKGPTYTPDPVLINGILSASHGVASSVQGLVTSTNSTIKSRGQNGEEEAIIASANAIATSTNHLFSASKAKSDGTSKIQQQLQQAIKTVAQATARLVSAAQTYTVLVETVAEEESNAGLESAAGGVRRELEFQIKIIQLEKALQREKKRQIAIKQAKYT